MQHPGSDDPLDALLKEPDPLIRYDVLTAAQTAHEELVKRIAAERGKALSQMRAADSPTRASPALWASTQDRAFNK